MNVQKEVNGSLLKRNLKELGNELKTNFGICSAYGTTSKEVIFVIIKTTTKVIWVTTGGKMYLTGYFPPVNGRLYRIKGCIWMVKICCLFVIHEVNEDGGWVRFNGIIDSGSYMNFCKEVTFNSKSSVHPFL